MGRVMNVVCPDLDEEPRWGYGRGLSKLARAMGCAQLRKAPTIVASMTRSHRRIKEGIGEIPGLRFRPLADPEDEAGSFLITYWPDAATAKRAADALKAEGAPEWIFHLQDYGSHMYYHQRALVQKVDRVRGTGCPWDCPHNRGSDYMYDKGSAPKSDEIFSRGVVMAVPSVLTDDQCDRIARAYRKVAAHLLG
jgi:dTDP-4-amino-4,6-dideoxygalactose transaminase